MARDRSAANAYRRRAFGDDPERRVAFVCECVDDGCRRAVLMTGAEYDEVRASGRALVVDASHEPPDERI